MEGWDESPEDRASYRDSDQFDEDSLSSVCSWLSESEIIGGLTWKGWKNDNALLTHSENSNQVPKLLDVAAKVVASSFPFQAVEEYRPPVPEQIQMKIAFWSFPQNEDNIQLYSCIAHGKVDEFQAAELLLRQHLIKDVIQIGFHLTGRYKNKSKTDVHNVSVTFDRCRILTCSCACNPGATWCLHIIALCLFRMRFPELVSFRAPISESLSKLQRDQLQKFTQYLIYELPSQVLPTAQRLLDELLMCPASQMNELHGAPDPTTGAGYVDLSKWLLDVDTLRENIRKILCKFYGLSPVAFVDFNSTFFSSAAPASSVEWMSLLRPLITREPEGLWNLLDIVKDLFRGGDQNSSEILQILTEECLNVHQLSLWWFLNGVEEGNSGAGGNLSHHALQTHAGRQVSTVQLTKNAGARLLDECVDLWKVALISARASLNQKQLIKTKLEAWQKSVVEKAKRGYASSPDKFTLACKSFIGFRPAIDVAARDWSSFLSNFDVNLDDDTSSVTHSQQSPFETEAFCTAAVTPEAVEDTFTCVYVLDILGFASAKRLASALATQLLSIPTTDYHKFSVAVKSSFLCRVLKDYKCQHVAFKLALFALAIPRKPALTKSEEVKLVHCEMNLRSALLLMTIGRKELELIRLCIQSASSCCARSVPQSKPLIFSIYVLEVLVEAAVQSRILKSHEIKFSADCKPSESDKEIGYQFAVSSLAWRSDVTEMKHTMLCESMRRFRNDLALSLLLHFKKDAQKHDEILSFLFAATCEQRRKASNAVQKSFTFKEDASDKSISLLERSSEATKDTSEESRLRLTTQVCDNIHEDENLDVDLLLCNKGDIDNAEAKHTDPHSFGNSSCMDYVQALELRCASKSSSQKETCTYFHPPYKVASINTLDPKSNASAKLLENTSDTIISESAREVSDVGGANSSSWYHDGKNTWDPALSWAERCEWEEGFSSPSADKHSQGSSKRTFHNKARREIYDFQIECDSFAFFELAKDLNLKAADRESIGRPIAKKTDDHGLCEQMQMTSLKLAVFSLELQNRVSPKWLSRTYSPHVAWIGDRSVDIGLPALQLLNEQWENTLTPTELLNIATRAWRNGDSFCKRAAAELAVSCLPQAHTLNPGEIQEAINLCKEEDSEMLERACISIESAAVKGAVQPEILFLVAKHWQVIHENALQGYGQRRSSNQERSCFCCLDPLLRNEPRDLESEKAHSALFDKDAHRGADVKHHVEKVSALSTACKGFKVEPLAPHEDRLSDQTVRTAEQYVQRQMHRMAHEMLKQSFLQQKPSKSLKDNSTSHWGSWQHAGVPNQFATNRGTTKSKAAAEVTHSNPAPGARCPSHFESHKAICSKLDKSFRIGIRALDALAGRRLEERADGQLTLSTPCSDDIRWLCALSASLGPAHLRSFCASVIPSVCSPYLLHDLALEAARNFAIYNPAQLSSHLQSPAVYPIVLKCLAMYTDLVRRDLVLLTQVGYPEFVELLRRVRSAFCMAPGGMTRFNELLEMIKKSCPKKRDLWQPIMNGLSRA